MTILEDLQERGFEVDTDLFDNQLLFLVNSAIAQLIRNGVPITTINSETQASHWEMTDRDADYHTILEFITYDALPKFTDVAQTSLDFFNQEKMRTLYDLKARFDSGVV